MKTLKALAIVALFPFIAPAQNEPQDSTPAVVGAPVTVVKSWRADFGDRSIYLNRVVPPALQEAPAVVPDTTGPSAPTVVAPGLVPSKKTEILFLSATVYNHRITEFRWTADGLGFRAYSNVDFNLLAGVPTFESADTIYLLLLAVLNPPAQIGQPSQTGTPRDAGVVQTPSIPALDKLNANHAQYIVGENPDGSVPTDQNLAALDAMHRFYDANRQQLAEAYAARKAARIEQEAKATAPPPKPPAIVVNFWPGKNTVIVEGNNGAMK